MKITLLRSLIVEYNGSLLGLPCTGPAAASIAMSGKGLLIMSDRHTLSLVQREHIYRRNFFIFLVDNVIFTIGMNIIGPTTVIPDFIRRLTGSEVLIGLSSSLFDIGWMLPQLFVARYLLRVTNKKWWFIGPNIPVRFAVLIFAIVTFILSADNRAALLIAFLIAYGIAALGDGLVGVPWVDLLGSSLDDQRRARMFGLATASVGVIMLAIAPVVGYILNEGPDFPDNYALLFALAGGLFVITIPLGLLIHELPGGTATPAIPPFREFIPELSRVLRQDSDFRAVVITRMLSSLFMMAGPFYIGFATEQLDLSSGDAVRNLLAMQTAGSVVGALLYSWMGARNNLRYMRVALLAAAVLPGSALLAALVGPLPLYLGFFAGGLAISNLFSSYLNWVIMHVNADQRPVYTGLFNTVAAVMLLAAPLIGGTIAEHIGYEAVFLTALIMVLSALFVATRYITSPLKRPAAPIT